MDKIVWTNGKWSIIQRGENHYNAIANNTEYSGFYDLGEKPPIPKRLENLLEKYNGIKRKPI